jgi:hypothetical protein
VRLLDEAGTNLIANGDFSRDGDYWFFKSGDHLPWHIKNLWVHLLYELGWVGLILITFLLTVSLWRLGRSLWRGELERTMMLAALAGLLTVGVVDSLVDAPRLGMLLCFLLLAGAWNTDFKQPDKTGNAMNGSSRSRSRTGLSSKSHHLRGYTHAADVSHHPRGDYVSGTVLSPTTSGNRKK